MNFEMLLTRDPKERAIAVAEIEQLIVRVTALLPDLAGRREELLKEQERLVKEGADGYFLTSDWEIDLGVFMNTGKTPSHYSDVEFYARLLFYIYFMQQMLTGKLMKLEDKLMATADIYFFHVKDLAEQGDEKAREVYEELRKVRPGGDKP